jgi:PAS domain S-box-containing protein
VAGEVVPAHQRIHFYQDGCMGHCRHKILVVEDNPVFLRLLGKLLIEEEGHQVTTAGNGLEALAILEDFLPDIIIVDWVMDKISGEQFCKIIRSKPHLQNCYLVILSGMAAEAETELLAAGADAYIAKGSFQKTAEHIRQVLAGGRRGVGRDFSRAILGLDAVSQRQATVELLRRNRHYELILHNMHDAVVVLAAGHEAGVDGLDLPIIFVNQAACTLFGRSEELLLTSPLAPYFSGPEGGRLAAALAGLGDGAVRIEADQALRVNDRYVSAFFIPFIDGDETYITAVLHDITEQKLLEQQQFMYNSLIEQSSDSIYVIEPESGALAFANRQALTSLGYELDDSTPLTIHDISPRLARREDWQRSLAAIRTTAGLTFESVHRRKDGTIFPVEVNARVVRYDGHDFVIGIARDISDRKRAEEAAREERGKLEAVVNALDTGLTLQDRNFVILYQNDQHRRQHGDHVGEICYEAFHGRAAICPGCLLEKCFADGKSHHRETEREVGGRRQYMDVIASPFFDANGQVIGGVETVKDITARKVMEMQMQQTQKMEAIGALAGGIAHDFNNILAAIMGYSEMALQDTPRESRVHAMLEHVVMGAERARDLVKQILTFSRKGNQQKAPTLLQPIVKEVMKLLRATMPSTIAMVNEISPQCGAVLADPTMVHQLIMNLCTNSCHAMQDKGGCLTIRLAPVTIDAEQAHGMVDLQEGPYVRLAVSDTGHGMEKEVLEHIFDPYYTTKAKGKGTGLGLAVVHGIVHNLGGAITVQSRVGHGTTFEVFLPLHGGPAMGEPEVRQAAARGDGHILLVDDEVPVTTMAAEILGRLGYRVSRFNSSRQALAAFMANPGEFDLIITDQTMPEYTGLELIRQVKEVNARMPVLLMSGYSEQVDAESSRAMGLDGYLAKPFRDFEIARAVSSILAGGKNGQ